MNAVPFSMKFNNEFGRKVAYTNAAEITPANIEKVMSKASGIFSSNKAQCEYLWNYFKGDQPVKYRCKRVRPEINNKIVENHAFEIVQFKTSQTYGEQLQCVSCVKDDSVGKAVDLLNTYLKNAFKQARDIECGEWQSATGTAFKAVQYTAKGSEVPFRIIVPTPLDTCIVYSSSTKEPMLAFQKLKDENDHDYYLCYTDTFECIIVDGKLVEGSWKLHGFGGIPIVEYPNNASRISDIELVIDLLDAINNMQSNRMDGIEQFIQAFMKFVNCEIDQETFKAMKDLGAFTVKSNNGENKAEVDMMTQQLDQTQSQVAKEDLWKNALSISAIPSSEKTSAGDTQGAVELRNGWDFSKSRAMMKDPFVVEAEKRLDKIVLHAMNVRGVKCELRSFDYEIVINHSPLDNIVVKCQSLQYLLAAGIHPLVALKTCGLWSDVEKVFILSKPYLDAIYKTVEMRAEEEQRAQKLLNDRKQEPLLPKPDNNLTTK